MISDDLALRDLLKHIGFDEVEIGCAFDELDQYRSIPGTNALKFLRRAVASVDDEERASFLKGLIAGASLLDLD